MKLPSRAVLAVLLLALLVFGCSGAYKTEAAKPSAAKQVSLSDSDLPVIDDPRAGNDSNGYEDLAAPV
jgi:PBP1b-binding outer membrane lipoprotein LpoB